MRGADFKRAYDAFVAKQKPVIEGDWWPSGATWTGLFSSRAIGHWPQTWKTGLARISAPSIMPIPVMPAGLIEDEALVEVEATAILPRDRS